MIIKWRRVLFHPISLGFILSILVIFFCTKYFHRYYAIITDESVLKNNAEIYYSDLDKDGNSEKMDYYHYDKIFQPTLYLYNSDDSFKALWDFLDSPINDCRIFFGDYNNDKIKEIFVFTEQADSIFLYILDTQNDKKKIKSRRFITKIEKVSNNLEVCPVGLFNLNSTNCKEFLFYIDAGYPLSPRNIFSYDILNDSLLISPNINAKITKPFIVDDIDSDGNLEIIISTESVNIKGNGTQLQLVALNSKLEYLFNPVSFTGSNSKISISKLNSTTSERIVILNSGVKSDDVFNNLMIFNLKGERILEKTIDCKSNLKIINSNDKELLLFTGFEIFKYDKDLNKEGKYKVDKNVFTEFVVFEDVNGDFNKELIFKGKEGLIFLDENLKTKTKISISQLGKISSTIRKSSLGGNQLSIQIGDKLYMINYFRNETFFYSYIFYLLVFFIITLFVFIIFNLKNRKIKINNLLFSKDNDEDVYNDLEKNINEEIIGLKSNLSEVKEELSAESFNKVNHKFEFESGQENKIKLKILKNRIVKITNTLKEKIIVTISFFPDKEWSNVDNNIEKDLLDLIKRQLIQLSKVLKADNTVNLQIIRHSDYINILFELDKVLPEKDIFKKDNVLAEILHRTNGKSEINQFAESGSIVNIILPLKSKDYNVLSNENKIKIILAEDHDVSLFGLMSLFKTKKDIEVVGTGKNGMEVLKILETKKTDIIITDISMPGMDGIELSKRVQEEYPEIKIIVFTMYLENWFIEQLIINGAMGFVSKNSKIVELVDAVRNVYEGNNYYCPQFKSKYGFNNGYSSSESKLGSLTQNELEIMNCFANNMDKSQIAEKLFVSNEVLDSFIANILLKLNAGDEEEIVSIAKKQKYISE